MAAVPKLIYFDLAGRAEAIRNLFRLGNIQFEDVRISREEFQAKKEAGEFPYGQLPVLVVGDEVLAQSSAIGRYVAKLGGFYSEDPLEALRIDELVEHVNDIGAAVGRTFVADEEEKARLRRELVATTLPRLLGYLERRVHPTGPFARGERITLADVYISSFMFWLGMGVLDHIPTDLIKDYPNIERVHKAVLEHPTLVAHYSQQHK